MDYKKLLEEIKHTYADNQDDGKSFEETENIRRLEWKAEESVSGDMLETALKATGVGYNDFEPISIARKIILVDPEARVFVAREGSVCLYILTCYHKDMMKALNADEDDLQPDGSIRFWWV